MGYEEEISAEELRKLQQASMPDDSVSVPQFEGTTPQDAAGNVKRLSKKMGAMDEAEASEYADMEQIADHGGVLIEDAE